MNGEEFRQLRVRKGFLTRQSLAEWLSVSYWTIQRWETGTRPVRSYAVSALNRKRDAPKTKRRA